MWEISVSNQTTDFLLSLCLGGIFCAIYDMVRAIRKVWLKTYFKTLLVDISVWVFYALVTFIFLLTRTNGELRGYVFAGELIGFSLLRISLSRYLYLLLVFLFGRINAFAVFINKATNRIYEKVESFFLTLCKNIIKKGKIALKSLKKLLKNTGRLLYTERNMYTMENKSE